MDNLNWEDFSPTPADPNELKKIKKSIRKHNWLTVLTSVVLVAVLIFGAIQYGIPALESRYWDPNISSYSEYIPDLTFSMIAHSELFVPRYNVSALDISKHGFAAHDLSILCFNEKNRNEWSYYSGSLVQGELNLPFGLWDYTNIGFYNCGSIKNAEDILNQLPNYVKVQANVSFPEDLDMYQITELQNWMVDYEYAKYKSVDAENKINWVAIRTHEDLYSTYPLCGMKPFTLTFATNLKGKINEYYPYFSNQHFSNSNLEDHFLSLLEYSADQVDNGTGILPDIEKVDANIYRNILSYVEENGIYSFGCTITASPEILLEMIELGKFSTVLIQDIWIGF